jgi:alkane 1-monooxygenase
MADVLLAMTLYSHFRSEHLLVHHRYVGTPRDPVTARYNEGFHRFFRRVIVQCWKSAFHAEKDMLRRKGLPWYDQSNPFWRYWMLQGIFLALAIIIGGDVRPDPVPVSGVNCSIPFGIGELHRTLWVNPQTSGGRQI